ncbi:MAG: hypothetical protein ACR2PG_18810, partial [Hyphomicrobiaceae bacterium]
MNATDSAKSVPPQVELRPPEMVMRLSRLGAFFPTRLSFMRTLIRELSRAGAKVTNPLWQLDAEGYGRAVYCIGLGEHTYSLVAFSQPLSAKQRTDRVIAEAWDTSYVLFDGVPGRSDIDRLAAAVPLQEAGRFTPRDLILSRANRSMRLFDHVIECLANGRQPEGNLIRSIGYLMRTTAVYGNGKFGIADRSGIANRPFLDGPFRLEMLAVWLIRGFTFDLVEHIARQRKTGRFVALESKVKKFLGVGNATGLGMAPFLVNHPKLLHNWMHARELALARVRALSAASSHHCARMEQLIDRAWHHLADWSVEDVRQMRRIEILRSEFTDLGLRWRRSIRYVSYPWDQLVRASQDYSEECQELVLSLVLEPHGDLIDDIEMHMSDDSMDRLRPGMRVTELLDLVRTHWNFALETDFSLQNQNAVFWYVSEEKLEPRLGRRFEEAGAERELPLDIARRV